MLGWAGWLGVVGREGRFNKEGERECALQHLGAMPLTADLAAYLKADVSGLTYFWKR